MTKAELIFFEMMDSQIFERAKKIYEYLNMNEKGLLSVIRPSNGCITILAVDLGNKIRDAVSINYNDFLNEDFLNIAKKNREVINEKRESVTDEQYNNSYVSKFNKEVVDNNNEFVKACSEEIVRLIKMLPDKAARKIIRLHLK